VNFFGHAVVARWRSGSAGFVLGSMLPDFATMIGARPPRVGHPELEGGIAFHHATDRVFHEAPTFVALQRQARERLRALGLPRPAALAVGHIGVEILLDAVLAADDRGVSAYLTALGEGHPRALGAHMDWGGSETASRYETLRAALAERGISAGAGEPRTVAWRVTRALAPRPRLRLTPDGERLVLAWAEESKAIVESAAPSLMGEVTRGLSATAVAPFE
jgi:hypothetical protein